MALFKAFIRVVKSLSGVDDRWGFGSENIIEERSLKAEDKSHVKQILQEKYPQFFQNGKVYEKETKDQAQFFYVVIYPLSLWEIKQIDEGEWKCEYCGEVHENKYISRPYISQRLFPGKMFCQGLNGECISAYKKSVYSGLELPDDENYIKKDSPVFIYKCTEKSTGKSYVGKTRNAPFFRWWNHLTHSSSPFGMYLRTTSLSDWTFEVLEQLPFETKESEVFEIESKYIVQFDCIANGYNSVISKKQKTEIVPSQMNILDTQFN